MAEARRIAAPLGEVRGVMDSVPARIPLGPKPGGRRQLRLSFHGERRRSWQANRRVRSRRHQRLDEAAPAEDAATIGPARHINLTKRPSLALRAVVIHRPGGGRPPARRLPASAGLGRGSERRRAESRRRLGRRHLLRQVRSVLFSISYAPERLQTSLHSLDLRVLAKGRHCASVGISAMRYRARRRNRMPDDWPPIFRLYPPTRLGLIHGAVARRELVVGVVVRETGADVEGRSLRARD